MVKRYISLFFLALAQTMMLGHNLIPHHHQDPFESLFIKSHPCSHHHHEHPYGMLESMFSLVPHSEKGMEATHCTHIEQPVSKQNLLFSGILPSEFQLKSTFIILKHSFPPHSVDFDPHDKILPPGLRAPPFFT
jgi:hypothetical protein